MSSNTRKNAATARFEKQRQAKHDRHRLLLGLLLGSLVVVCVVWFAKPSSSASTPSPQSVNANGTVTELVHYADGNTDTIDKRSDEQSR
jgi:hypothetical protein